MNEPFPEPSESLDERATPPGDAATAEGIRQGWRDDRGNQVNRSWRHPRQRRQRDWHERCEPGSLPCLSMPSAVLGFVAGLGCAISLGFCGRWLDTRSSAAPDVLVPPCPQDVAAAYEQQADAEDLGFMTSEAGMDQHAREEAEKIRLATEQHLAQTDEISVWRLDDWRQPLGTFQDMIIQLAGVATGGGTWAGHEMRRNDLTLEADLLSLHAEALSTDPSAAPPPKAADRHASRRRAMAWQSLWSDVESTAETLRASPDIDDNWKIHLDSSLNEARKAHRTLGVMLEKLADAKAAQAVIDYCQDYFSEEREMFRLPDSADGR